ncbi:hypothetical protein [Vibrio crassostreae]|uniref:hypothetical protein n=1 Tax=Vibrio crassostreae TaxID=246167 RepID=UPI001B312F5B|nr:hypothetical protein [Vibrio crassostreae]
MNNNKNKAAAVVKSIGLTAFFSGLVQVIALYTKYGMFSVPNSDLVLPIIINVLGFGMFFWGALANPDQHYDTKLELDVLAGIIFGMLFIQDVHLLLMVVRVMLMIYWIVLFWKYLDTEE